MVRVAVLEVKAATLRVYVLALDEAGFGGSVGVDCLYLGDFYDPAYF